MGGSPGTGIALKLTRGNNVQPGLRCTDGNGGAGAVKNQERRDSGIDGASGF